MSRLPRGAAWLCGTLFACVLIIGFTCTPASAGPAQQDCPPAWREVFSPPLPSGRADLYGLAVAGPHDIWAVGTAALAENNGQYETFTEHWDGTMWRTVPSPNRNPDHPIDNRLADVAAVGPRDVWAVGWREALSGTSALGNNQTLIEHWDGTVWSLVPSPNPSPDQANRLVRVAAAGPNDVWAVGQAGAQPLLIHWDGARWMEVSIPSVPDAATGLDSIAVTGPTDIWILGHYYPNNGDWGAAIIHWDGQSWTLTKLTAPMFDPNLTGAILTLRAIAATSPSDAWIAGDLATYAPGPNPKAPPVLLTIQTLIGHWDGSAWKRVESPNPGTPGGGGTLYGIAAAGPRDVWAVGSYFSPSGQQTLTLHWNGNYWVIVPSPNNDPNNNFQYSVVAMGPQEAWAAGSGMLIHYAGGCSAPSPTPKPTDRVPDPHLPGVLYFPVVGHSLQGGFRAYWEAHGGLAQFGYPLTEEFKETSPTDGRVYTIQYFERNRFEWHPENRPPYDILLGLLGDTVTQECRPEAPFRPLVLSPPYPPYYMLTGHIVAPQFVAYWQNHGGLPVYGYPLSEAFTETSPTDGKPYLVQYFERNRLEYHPELPDPFRVSLGLLGVQVLQARGWLP